MAASIQFLSDIVDSPNSLKNKINNCIQVISRCLLTLVELHDQLRNLEQYSRKTI